MADGDTLTVITANHTKLRVRMFGIDAPETPKGAKFPGQPYGPEAEAYLKQLVEAGLAEVYRGPESGNPYKQQYQVAEDIARSRKKGMWVLGDSYESPRAYRKRVGIS